MKKQTIGNQITVKLIICSLCACGMFQVAQADDDEKSETATNAKSETKSSSASISGSVSNGEGVVTYNGEEVWKGKINDALRTVAGSNSINDKTEEHAAARDGDTLLWENVPGAGESLGDPKESADVGEKMKELMEEMKKGAHDPDRLRKLVEEMMSDSKTSHGDKKDAGNGKGNEASASAAIGGSVNNGEGIVTYNDEEVWKGKIEDELRTAAKASGDKEKYDGDYAAAWDGDEVVWENVPGAAKELADLKPTLDGNTNMEEMKKKKEMKKMMKNSLKKK